MRDATHHRIHGIADDHGAEWVLHQPGVWTAPRNLNEALAAGLAPRDLAVHVAGNHGRWIVNCPDCNGAQLAAPKDHRFMCNVCANVVIDGLWRPVIWPRDPDKLATILNQRGAMDTRNYEPGETSAMLKEQNAVLDATEAAPVQLQGADFPKSHSHSWPKRVSDDTIYTCGGCGAMYDGSAIKSDRKPS